MNTQTEKEKRISQLRLAVDIEEMGLLWEVDTNGVFRKPPENASPLTAVLEGFKIRLPLSTPQPPLDPYADLKAAHKAGKMIQYNVGSRIRPDWQDCQTPQWNADIAFYRIKPWILPAPPEGRKWHNGHLFVEGDLRDGERPLLAGEEIRVTDEFFGLMKSWSGSVAAGLLPHKDFKYRTRRPLPSASVKLGPDDVPPGSVVRLIQPELRASWLACIGALSQHVILASTLSENVNHVTYEELMANWEILRPNSTWQPCKKELKP